MTTNNCYNCAFGTLNVDEILNNETVDCNNENSQFVWGRLNDIIRRPECPYWRERSGRNVYEWIKPEALKKIHDEVFLSDPLKEMDEETKEYLEKKFIDCLRAQDVLLYNHSDSKLTGLTKDDFKKGAFEKL